MPNYSSLRLSTGGGLISDAHKATQRNNTANIIIGCGGTGKDAIKQLKKSMFTRVLPDNPDAPLPEFSHTKFLSIDTDRANLKQTDTQSRAERNENEENIDFVASVTDIDERTEFFYIGSNSIEGKINAYAKNEKAGIRNAGFEWLNASGIDKIDASAGAGGIRQIGRLLLVEQIVPLKQRIQDIISDAIRDLTDPKVQFFIFAGIGGGTGSGIFLDICYLIQKIKEDMALSNIATQAMLFMPDVNLDRVKNPNTRDYIKRNGYCALREIDYCMNLGSNGKKWKQELGGANHKEYDSQPADIVNLISSKTDKGAVFTDGYQYAMNVAADFTIDLLCESNGFDFDSHKANHSMEVKSASSKNKYGGNYHYSILGAAAIEVPFRKIMTYLASALYVTKFEDIKNNKPTTGDYEKFQNVVGLGSGIGNADAPLFKYLRSGEEQCPYVKPEYGEYKDDFKNGSNSPLIRELDKTLNRHHGIWMQNYKNLTGKLEDYSSKHASGARSIINRIYHELISIITDVNRGPYYAKELLNGGHGENLLNAITGLKTWSDRKRGTAIENYEYNERHYYNPAHHDFKNKVGLLSSPKGRYDRYADACIKHYEYLDDTGHNENGRLVPGRTELFNSMLDIISEQITNLAGQISVLCSILDELEAVFTSNYNDLNSGVELDFVDGVYVKELFKVTDKVIKTDLDRSVQNINREYMFTKITKWLLDSHDDWTEDSKIAAGISAMLKNEFNLYAERSLENYMEDHFNVKGNPAQLQAQLENQFYPELKSKADPLFWTNPIFSMANVGKFGYVSAPANCSAIVNAASNFVNTPGLEGYHVRKSAQEDRIQIQVFASGVPMYAYQGQELYKDEFMPFVGQGHGCSSHEADEDWSKLLPFITPATILRLSESNAYDVTYTKARYALYNKALGYNILTEGPFNGADTNENLYLHLIDFKKLNAELNNIKADLNANHITPDTAVVKAKALLETIERQKAAPPTAAQIGAGDMSKFVLPEAADPEVIETSCLAGSEKEVRFDNFVRIRGFNTKTEEEVEKFETYVNSIEDFCEEVKRLAAIRSVRDIYIRALFSGLISINDNMYEKISFTPIYDNIEDEEIELSKPMSKFAKIGIYQAYLTFLKQPEKLLEDAKKRADDIYANDQNTLRASLNNIRATVLSNDIVKRYTRTRNSAENWTTEEKEDIQKFITSLVGRLNEECDYYHVDSDLIPEKKIESASADSTSWTCSCGHTGNKGKCCTECGKPKPVNAWDCTKCGNKGNTGKFCSECGTAPTHIPGPGVTWDCPVCGNTGNTGKCCNECGKMKPWDCQACGTKGNTGKFCSECGAKM